jgi:hypothetical protein
LDVKIGVFNVWTGFVRFNDKLMVIALRILLEATFFLISEQLLFSEKEESARNYFPIMLIVPNFCVSEQQRNLVTTALVGLD